MSRPGLVSRAAAALALLVWRLTFLLMGPFRRWPMGAHAADAPLRSALVALRRDTIGRLLTILGVVAAVVVPLLLLLTWGHTELSVYRSAASYAVIRTTRSFDGGDLASSFRLKLLCLSGAVVLLGALSMIRPAHHRVIGLLAGLAMTAQVVVIAIELNSSDLSHAAFQNPNVDNFVAQFSSPVYVAAFVASGGGALIWLALAALSTNHKVCPDCASRVQRSAINCPHCDYEFPLQSGLKRCEECRRPVSSEALVCRHCKHRFGAAPASAA